MTTLLLVRHGHTDAAGKRLTGRAPGVHLNELGRRQAERLVERLDGVRIDAIVSSPLERCRETAAPLAKARGRAVDVGRAWIEVGYGEWTGRSISQLRRTKLWRRVMFAPSNVRFPGGESLLEVQGAPSTRPSTSRLGTREDRRRGLARRRHPVARGARRRDARRPPPTAVDRHRVDHRGLDLRRIPDC